MMLTRILLIISFLLFNLSAQAEDKHIRISVKNDTVYWGKLVMTYTTNNQRVTREAGFFPQDTLSDVVIISGNSFTLDDILLSSDVPFEPRIPAISCKVPTINSIPQEILIHINEGNVCSISSTKNSLTP